MASQAPESVEPPCVIGHTDWNHPRFSVEALENHVIGSNGSVIGDAVLGYAGANGGVCKAPLNT